MKWRALALEFEMKISYLERALAQEESKLRIAEQVRKLQTGLVSVKCPPPGLMRTYFVGVRCIKLAEENGTLQPARSGSQRKDRDVDGLTRR